MIIQYKQANKQRDRDQELTADISMHTMHEHIDHWNRQMPTTELGHQAMVPLMHIEDMHVMI